jgi:Protein of unknown function (DUF3800)
MSSETLHLYLDDSGSRYPDHKADARKDGMDHFALGGLLIESERVEAALEAHQGISKSYSLEEPLHSNSIRCAKRSYLWLKKDPERAALFFADLEKLICDLPGLAIACVIDRPGYNVRYAERYGKKRWMLCKTAYTIVVERAAKLAMRAERRLRVYVEATGPKEDRAIKSYHSDLLANGMYFNAATSGKYSPMTAEEFSKVLLKEPKFVPKSHPLSQLSDLLLYPIIKGRYDPKYRPYRSLRNARRLIDDVLEEQEIASLGIKYSCFDSG